MAQQKETFECSVCKEIKEIRLQRKNRKECKSCHSERQKQIQSKYRLFNESSDWIRPIIKWCPDCKDFIDGNCFKTSLHSPDGLSSYCKFHEIIRQVEKRNQKRKIKLEFSLTKNEVYEFIKQPCYYCGNKKDNIGIDRIFNDIGYLPENCVSCCWMCNDMKGDVDVGEFLYQVEKIYNYRVKKLLKELDQSSNEPTDLIK
jgi:hypothetical protein